MEFSKDNKHLAVQIGEPDWTFQLWGWEKGKLLASIKIPITPDFSINSISFHPFDVNMVCISGESLQRTYRLSDGMLKLVNCPKFDGNVCT